MPDHPNIPLLRYSIIPVPHLLTPVPAARAGRNRAKRTQFPPAGGWTPEAKRAKRTQFPPAGGWAPVAKCAKRTRFPPAGDGRRRQNVRNEPNFPCRGVGTGGKTCETNPISWPGSKAGSAPWPLTPGTLVRQPVCSVRVRAGQKTPYGVTTNRRADLAPASGSVPRGLCHLERAGLNQASLRKAGSELSAVSGKGYGKHGRSGRGERQSPFAPVHRLIAPTRPRAGHGSGQWAEEVRAVFMSSARRRTMSGCSTATSCSSPGSASRS
jgi:hypothetical protein